MNRILLISLLLCCPLMNAQTYEKVSRNNLWNDGSNVAGMRQDSISAAFAEIYGAYYGGGLHDYGEPSHAWKAGARTMAIRHLQRLSMSGSFSFEQTMGYDMFGSMFIDPGYYPVDIIEFTPGRKSLQEYTACGAISFDIDSRWRIGAGLDFRSANMAKVKDLRHTNYKLDFSVKPSVQWHNGKWAAGMNAVIGKRSESINAELVGSAESIYYAFFDKGLMYGTYQGWEGSGIHLKEAGVNGFPVKEIFGGFGLQMSWTGLYVDMEFLYRSGVAGEKDFLWFRFPGYYMSSQAGYIFRKDNYKHNFRLHISALLQENNEAVIEKVTDGGVTVPKIYSYNRIFQKRIFCIRPEYEVVSDLWELRWNVLADISSGMSSQKYPFVCAQNIIRLSTGAETMVHVRKFDLGAGVEFGKGFLNEQNKTLLQTAENNRPDRLDDYYDYRVEYIRATCTKAQLKARFNFRKGLYAQAEGEFVHAFNVTKLPGCNRFSCALRLGYDF